jgi:Aldo/keto reductases, related to diketogulonate reductase
VNQILAHVGNTPFDLVEYSQKQGILVEAYSPVAHGAILGHEEVARLAAHYGVSVPQLCIRYCLELGMLPLPKTANPDHMRTNASLDFTIAPSDMEVLKAVAPVVDYGEGGKFPVFGGTLYADGRLEKGNYKRRS